MSPTLAITYTPEVAPTLSPIGYRFAGITFQLEATDQAGNPVIEPSQPLTLTLTYNPTEVINESALGVYRYDPSLGDWIALPVIHRDPANDQITFQLDHLSEFALWEPGFAYFLPFLPNQ